MTKGCRAEVGHGFLLRNVNDRPIDSVVIQSSKLLKTHTLMEPAHSSRRTHHCWWSRVLDHNTKDSWALQRLRRNLAPSKIFGTETSCHSDRKTQTSETTLSRSVVMDDAEPLGRWPFNNIRCGFHKGTIKLLPFFSQLIEKRLVSVSFFSQHLT